MSTISKVLAKIVSNVLLSLTVIAAIALTLPKFFGLIPLTVLTGSMEPVYRPGDIVYVQKKFTLDEIDINDVITFQKESGVKEYVTHRVVGFDFKNNDNNNIESIQTKGDANNTKDDPVKPGQVMGIVKYSLPYIGNISNFASQSIANFGILSAGLLVYVGFIWGLSYYARSGENKENDTEKNNKRNPRTRADQLRSNDTRASKRRK